MSKWIYILYSPEHKAAYVGKTCNLKQRFYKHCTYVKGCVKQFCINHNNIKPRNTFDIYEIMRCDVTKASYYEGKTYELIQHYFPDIHLINKNIPNRSTKQWRKHNAERCRVNNKNWRENNLEHTKRYYKQWYITNYEKCRSNKKQWYATNAERCKSNSKKWRANNPEYNREWREKNPEYHKEYYQKRKLLNK